MTSTDGPVAEADLAVDDRGDHYRADAPLDPYAVPSPTDDEHPDTVPAGHLSSHPSSYASSHASHASARPTTAQLVFGDDVPATDPSGTPGVDPASSRGSADLRSVTSAAGAVMASAAPAPARTWTIGDVVDPPALPERAGDGSRGSRLAVAATTLVVAAALGGLGWLVYSAWRFVTTAPDAVQLAHWEQLRGLIDVVVAVVLLVVGTALGSSLQARWTTAARADARTQARAAAEQNAAARANAEAARRNAAAALTAGSDLTRALELLDQTGPLLVELQDLVADRDRTSTQFVTASRITSAIRETHVAGYRLDRGGDIRLAEAADEGVDRRLTTLSVRAGVLGGQISGWLVRRR